MQVAALYDIHGNLPALEAVLDELRQARIDRIVVGGDVVPGPMPRETVACLRAIEIPIDFIRGNGEGEVLAQLAGIESPWFQSAPKPWQEIIRWTASQLETPEREWLAGWPAQLSLTIDGLGDVLFCHATPRNDTECFTRLTAEEKLLPVFAGVDASIVVCGHTHMPFDRSVGQLRVVNAGSVGMPFGKPGAHWLLLGREIRFCQTDYDLEAAADRVRHTDYPQASDFADRSILRPPTEDSMLKAFARSEL